MKKQAIILVLYVLAFVLFAAQILAAQKKITESTTGHILFILDASKSMEEPIKGQTKIEIVREILSDAIHALPDSIKVEIIGYGQKHKEDCGDIADSIRKAAESSHAPEEKVTIILITDGKDNCSSDPCEELKQLKDTLAELQFILNVIGFDVNEEVRVQLECLARIGEGTYYSANTGQELKIAAENAIKTFIACDNFEAIVKDNAGEELIPWTGQIFSIKNGKPVSEISSSNHTTCLPSGNYVLMLHFEEDLPEMKGHRPFTFTINEDTKTRFTLLVGPPPEQVLEYDVVRYGSDYDNIEMLIDSPELCQAKCTKDPKCKAFTYSKAGIWEPNGRCWLKHSVPPRTSSPGNISGVIQRDSSPYQVHTTTEKLESND